MFSKQPEVKNIVKIQEAFIWSHYIDITRITYNIIWDKCVCRYRTHHLKGHVTRKKYDVGCKE